MDTTPPIQPAHRKSAPADGAKPFRLFFLLAAVDAVLGGTVWLPLSLSGDTISGASAGAWHRNALLFGTISAILAGFLLTALPRWTKRRGLSRPALHSLAAIWVVARAASLVSIQAGAILAAGFVLSLTAIAATPVIASRDQRNFKVVLLLLCFSASTVSSAAGWYLETALRLAISSMIALIAIIGGRVVPALTASHAQSIGDQLVIRPSLLVEFVAAATIALALAGWLIAPQSHLTGAACAIASCGQAVRLAQWRGWQSKAPWSIIALHVGYCWIIVGFALLSAHIFAAESVGRAAGIHAWTIGAAGTMGLALMASMIRKHSRRPFADSAPMTAAFASITSSCLSRLLAETPFADATLWTRLSAGLWILSFALFIAAYGKLLVSCRRSPL